MTRDDSEHIEAETVLGVLENPIRREIVAELFRGINQWEFASVQGLAFTELRERVDLTSQELNYHLNQLRGIFVKQDGNTYRPVTPARGLHELLSWIEVDHDVRGPEETAYDCSDCGSPLRVRYRSQLLSLACEEHPRKGAMAPVPYGCAKNRTLSQLLQLLPYFYHDQIERFRSGICKRCYGSIDPEPLVVRDRGGNVDFDQIRETGNEDSEEPRDITEKWVMFGAICQQCGLAPGQTAMELAVAQPDGRSFLREHDLMPFDKVGDFVTIFAEETHGDLGRVRSRNPIVLTTTLVVGADSKTFSFDESAALIQAE